MMNFLSVPKPGGFISHEKLAMFNYGLMRSQISSPLHPYPSPVPSIIETGFEALARISANRRLYTEAYGNLLHNTEIIFKEY